MGLRAAIGLSLAFGFPVLVHAETEGLPSLLARMDQAAASFRTMSADVRWVAHTAVINEDTVDTGSMFLKRSKRDMRMRVEFNEPDRKSVALHESKLEIYYPKIQSVDEYDIGNHRDLLEVFLVVGFGTSGKELSATFNVKVLGQEEIGGQRTTLLELIPKSPQILRNLKRLDLWMSSELYPVQQKFYLPGGDYKLVTYTSVKMNLSLSDADLKLKLPKDVKRVFPQR